MFSIGENAAQIRISDIRELFCGWQADQISFRVHQYGRGTQFVGVGGWAEETTAVKGGMGGWENLAIALGILKLLIAVRVEKLLKTNLPCREGNHAPCRTTILPCRTAIRMHL